MDHVGVVGDSGQKEGEKYTTVELNGTIPDLNALIKKEVINDVGGMSPSFDLYGQEFSEWCNRAISKGWKVVSCTHTVEHKDDSTHGKAKIPNFDQIYARNCDLVIKLKSKDFSGYNWWRNDLDIL
jgi:GT2 family glycosyltransferase